MAWMTVILGSAFLGTIVTGLFSWGEYQKANSLKYITEERSLWRKEMRGIIKEITTANAPEDIKAALAELKTWIDPRGLRWSGSLYDDHHIWETIERLENPKNSDGFLSDKQLLISFLYLLLKKDWRRSNHEVRFSKTNIKGKVLFLVSITLYICIYIGSCIYMYMEHRDTSKNTLPVLDINSTFAVIKSV
jgi:hypothetical protein